MQRAPPWDPPAGGRGCPPAPALAAASHATPDTAQSPGATLKGVSHEIFAFRIFFHESVSFPCVPEYLVGAIANIYENSRIYSQFCVHDNGDKLFTSDTDITGDKLSLVSLLSAIN